jgi:TonB-linked SusC/RagA family outer membrane protein
VKDTNDEPVIGATVVEKGVSGNGTATDVNGRFSLNVSPRATLVVSYIGYATVEVTVGNRDVIDVTLSETTTEIDEVIVVGYGVQRKSDVTGAIVSVSDKQLKDRPVSNMLEALQGKAAGVDITNNARPGELGSIRIRGERSITGSSNPLYVVNGIPLLGRDNINMLNTSDIKSVEILKDASATAIYGSRGANGVVLITTYSGEEGRFSVNYNGSHTVETLQDSREHFTSAEWIDFIRWANYYADTKNNIPADKATKASDQTLFNMYDRYTFDNVMKGWVDDKTWDGSRVGQTDWADFVIQNGISENHTLSVSGGTQKVTSFASFGFLDQKGTSIGQEYKRYTMNLNTVLKPFNWFELGVRVFGAWSDQEYGQDGTGAASASGAGSIYESAMKLYPIAIPYDENGERIILPGGQNSVKTVVDELDYSRNRRQILNLMTNTYAQIKLPLDGLSYRVEFGPSFRYRRNGVYVASGSAVRENQLDYVRLINQRDFTWTVNNLVNYNKKFDIHSVLLTLLQTASKNEQVGDEMTGRRGGSDDPASTTALWNSMGSIQKDNLDGWDSSLSEEQLTSYMARLNYSMKDRYLLTASGRWDASSVLAPGHKWAFFPSMSLAWRIEQEDFLKSIPQINQLKLRLGYGVVGNAAVSRYSTISDLFTNLYPYVNPNGSQDFQRYYFVNDLLATADRKAMPNLQLGWEKTAQYNIGLDFSVFKSRVSGVLEFYTSRTSDLLLNANIPSLTGYLTTTANVGATKNRGVDITLNTINIQIPKGFTWETNLSLAWQKNEIVELSNGKEDEVGDSRFIGEPIGVYYAFKAIGLWKEEDAEEMAKFNSTTAPDGTPKTAHTFEVGQVRIQDQDGDYVIDANHDRVIIGQTNPAWTGGMTNTFSYKGIELMVQMYGRLGYWTNGGAVSMGGKYMLRKVDYYNENNKDAAYQRPELDASGSDQDPNSSYLQYSKASFVNIRTISLGYVFPKKLIQNWGNMQNLRIYAQCVNPGALYQSVKWKNMDLNSAVWNRNFVIGLQVGF